MIEARPRKGHFSNGQEQSHLQRPRKENRSVKDNRDECPIASAIGVDISEIMESNSIRDETHNANATHD